MCGDPALRLAQAPRKLGYVLFPARGDEVIDLAKTNLFR
jgi:hypothetical protein